MSQIPLPNTFGEAIRQLVMNIHLLEEIKKKHNEFNVFNVLDINQYEIRHSNMLAWLLSPQQNHGLEDSFLKNFLREVFMNRKSMDAKTAFSVDEGILLYNLSTFKIEREVQTKTLEKTRYMDIVLTKDNDKTKKIKIVIENKIRAKEGNNQLNDYYTDTIKLYPESERWHHLFIYLDAKDKKTNSKEWISINYNTVINALETSLRCKTPVPEAEVIIKNYLSTLKDITGSDTSISERCRNIYRSHKHAFITLEKYINQGTKGNRWVKWLLNNYYNEINLILEHKIGPQDIVFEQIKKRNYKLSNDEAKRYQEFYSEKMDTVFPGGQGKAYKYFFYSWKDSIGVYFELLGSGYDEHSKIMKDIIEFQMSNSRKRVVNNDGRPFNQYRRIFSKIEKIGTEKNMEDEVMHCTEKLLNFLEQKEASLIKYLQNKGLVQK